MNNKKTIATVSAVIFVFSSTYTNLVSGESASQSSKSSVGRYVAISPPSAGDTTYGNFIWVLDTLTGNMVAHRIASVKDANGKHEAFVTERLPTDGEFAKYKKIINSQ